LREIYTKSTNQADTLYFRDPIQDKNNPVNQKPENIIKLACIGDIFDYPDYALELLVYLTIEYGDDPRYNLAQEIIQCLSRFPELVNQGLDSLPIVASIRHRLQ
jgi:hypothetical protein